MEKLYEIIDVNYVQTSNKYYYTLKNIKTNKEKHMNEARFSMIQKKGLIIDEVDKIQLSINSKNISNVFRIANNALYFADNSDYQTALYEICKVLDNNIKDEDIGKKYLEED